MNYYSWEILKIIHSFKCWSGQYLGNQRILQNWGSYTEVFQNKKIKFQKTFRANMSKISLKKFI